MAVPVPSTPWPSGLFCPCQLSSFLMCQCSGSPRQGCMQAADHEHELSPEPGPSPDWEGKPSREPELCQGTCQEQGGKDDCGPALSLCPGLILFTGIDRVHSQRGQEESTALNVFSTLGDICPAGLGNVFSCTTSVHMLLAFPALLSPPSPACFLPFHVCLSQMVQQKTCSYISSLLDPVMMHMISWVLICFMKAQCFWSRSPTQTWKGGPRLYQPLKKNIPRNVQDCKRLLAALPRSLQ